MVVVVVGVLAVPMAWGGAWCDEALLTSRDIGMVAATGLFSAPAAATADARLVCAALFLLGIEAAELIYGCEGMAS